MSRSICYSSCCCSRELYRRMWEKDLQNAPVQSVQKYHRLLAEGFYENGYRVNMISFPTLPKSQMKNYADGKTETENGVVYDYIPFSPSQFLKYPSAVYHAYKKTREQLKEGATLAMGDVLNVSVSLGCLLATKKEKKPFISIVTDLPGMLWGDSNSVNLHISEYIMKRSDGFIFLTEQMNDVVNKKKKPYIVLEGHVDGRSNQSEIIRKENKKFVVLYAGALCKQYGIDYLIDGFIKAHIEGAELHLYGNGDYAEKTIELSKKYSDIKYYGERLNEEVVKAEREATLLVNPRPTSEEYTKYSFPSKNMEYMLSGTPMLTTALPGMPKEYKKYVYLLREENSAGMARMLEHISKLNREELVRKGTQARKFVLEEKNNKIQANKIIEKLIDRYFA